jgi:uridine kinase
MRKAFASYSFHKRIISRIYEDLKTLNAKNPNKLINKWENVLNREFSKEVQVTKKQMKKISTSLAKKDMKIKITL